jgi:hypothetical protein
MGDAAIGTDDSGDIIIACILEEEKKTLVRTLNGTDALVQEVAVECRWGEEGREEGVDRCTTHPAEAASSSSPTIG